MKTLGPNPTLVQLEVPRGRNQRVGESRAEYLSYVARVARRALNKLRDSDDYRYCHDSFAVRDAMLLAEAACPDVGTFGVEYVPEGNNSRSPAIDYLNSGDTYELTLLYVNGRFRVGCWGDIVERGNYN